LGFSAIRCECTVLAQPRRRARRLTTKIELPRLAITFRGAPRRRGGSIHNRERGAGLHRTPLGARQDTDVSS
jgi:hypothetical protein